MNHVGSMIVKRVPRIQKEITSKGVSSSYENLLVFPDIFKNFVFEKFILAKIVIDATIF